MKNIVIGFLLLSLIACQSKENVLSEEVSESGLPYIFTNMPGNSRVSIYIAWPTDWYYSSDRNPAVPRIGAQMLLAGGATGYPAGQVVERFPDMNSEGDLWTSADYVYGVLHYSPEHQNETLKIVNAHLRSPLLDEKWLERIRAQYVEQTNEYRDSGEVQGFEASRWAMLGEQPLRAGLSVHEQSVIEAATKKDVADWASAVFKRKGVYISIAGDLSTTDAGLVVDALFDGLPAGVDAVAGVAEVDMSPKRIQFHAPKAKTNTLTFFGKLPPESDGSLMDDQIIISALNGGFDGGLFGAVRNELRATYNYGAGTDEYTADNRLLIMSGQIETSKIAEAENIIRKVYAEFRANPSIEDLPKIKKEYEIRFKEDLKDTGSVAYNAMVLKMRGMSPALALNLQAELDAITIETLEQRLKDVYPKADEFVMVLSSADRKALPDACVVEAAKDALGC